MLTAKCILVKILTGRNTELTLSHDSYASIFLGVSFTQSKTKVMACVQRLLLNLIEVFLRNQSVVKTCVAVA